MSSCKGKQYSAADIARHVDGVCLGDETRLIERIADISKATPRDITFLSNPKLASQLDCCEAGIIITREQSVIESKQCTWVVVDDPYLAYAKLAQLMDNSPSHGAGIHPTAVVHENANVSSSAFIGPNVVIEEGVVIDDNAVIGAGAYVGHGCQIGKSVTLHPNTTIYHHTIIGDSSIIHSGAVIGADGFGFANQAGDWVKIPQVGCVELGAHVEIGANTTIDRGAIENTIIHEGVKIDNMCHIAHNVEIGKNTAMAGFSAVAGSAKIGAYCIIAGGVGINGHITIADKVHVTARTFVNRSIKNEGAVMSSSTIMQENSLWKKNTNRFKQLDDMMRRIVKLEKFLKKN